MKFARCTLDDQIYSAATFRGLADFHRLNEAMICLECGGRAKYRHTGSDGRSSSFTGKPHRDNCSIRTNYSVVTHTERNEPVPPEEQVLVVNFNTITAQGENSIQPTGGVVGNNLTQENAEQHQANPARHFSMRRILGRLMSTDNFIDWPATAVVPGAGRHETPSLFMNLLDVTADRIGEFHGYWGAIPNFRVDENSLWLNSGMPEHMSVLLDDQLAEEFYQRYPVDSMSELVGSHILVLGTLRQARRRGKLYVHVTDLNYFCLIHRGRI